MLIDIDKGAGRKPCFPIRVLCVLLICGSFFGNHKAFASTEATYKYTEETKEAEAFVAQMIGDENVHVGAGSTYKILVNPLTDKKVTLKSGDLIAVMSEVKVTENKVKTVWYEIRWVQDGVEFYGFIPSTNAVMTGDKAFPLPTATPNVSITPSPTPSTTPGTTNTPTPTKYTTPTLPPPGLGDYMAKDSNEAGLKTVGGVLLILLVGYAAYLVVEAIRGSKAASDRSSRYGRSVRAEEERRRREALRRAREKAWEREAENESKQPEEPRRSIAENTAIETEIAGRKIEELAKNDRIVHGFFGEGTVVDNSDPTSIAIRFGKEVRHINKENAAAKQLIRKL